MVTFDSKPTLQEIPAKVICKPLTKYIGRIKSFARIATGSRLNFAPKRMVERLEQTFRIPALNKHQKFTQLCGPVG